MSLSGSEDSVIAFFISIAYQPWLVYFSIVALLTASSFGLPIPEEITILAAGLTAYVASNPEVYIPPYPGAKGVHIETIALICFFAVFLSDLLIYFLGRFWGRQMFRTRYGRRVLSPRRLRKIEKWMQRHGAWCAAIFRFTPGLRFPGHFTCGMSRVPLSHFILIDGTAALLSVPTQIFLIGMYGREIFEFLNRFKQGIALILILTLCIYILYRWYEGRLERKN